MRLTWPVVRLSAPVVWLSPACPQFFGGRGKGFQVVPTAHNDTLGAPRRPTINRSFFCVARFRICPNWVRAVRADTTLVIAVGDCPMLNAHSNRLISLASVYPTGGIDRRRYAANPSGANEDRRRGWRAAISRCHLGEALLDALFDHLTQLLAHQIGLGALLRVRVHRTLPRLPRVRPPTGPRGFLG